MRKYIIFLILIVSCFGFLSCLKDFPGSEDVPPQNVKVEAYSQRAITISWDENENAESFNVYSSTISGFTPSDSNKIANTESSSYLHTGLESGTTYYYIVSAVYSGDVLKPADEVNASPRFLGVLDESYGTDGLVTKQVSYNDEDGDCFASALDNDNDVIIAVGVLSTLNVYKFDSDGKQITDFGDDGKVTITGTGFVCESIAVDSKNNIYIVGSKEDDDYENERINVWTLDSDGLNLDTITLSQQTVGRDIFIDADDNIFVLGRGPYETTYVSFIWGLEDDVLEQIAIVTSSEGYYYMSSLFVDEDGKFYVGGEYRPNDSEEVYPRLFKFKSDGTRDTSFGDGGEALYNNDGNPGGIDFIKINDAGNIYITGFLGNDDSERAVVLKYNSLLKKLVGYYESEDVPSGVGNLVFTDADDIVLPILRGVEYKTSEVVVTDFLALDSKGDLVADVFTEGVYSFPQTVYPFSDLYSVFTDSYGRVLFSGILMPSATKSYLGIVRFR